MNISSNSVISGSLAKATAAKAPDAPKKELQIKRDTDHVADRFDDSRDFGNGVAGVVTGATLETLDAGLQSPKLAWEIMENLWQAETIGINLKVLGTAAALPGAALSVVAAPFYGAYKGGELASKAGRVSKDVLPKDASPEATDLRFNGDSEDSKSLSSRFQESLEELGSRKLAPGEKKFDIPILSPVFAVIGGVVSAGVTGVIGLVAGLSAGLLTTGKEIVGGVKEGNIGRVLASPLHTGAIPYGLMKEGFKESLGRGFVDGWKHGPVKPVIDTIKSTSVLAGTVLKQAWER